MKCLPRAVQIPFESSTFLGSSAGTAAFVEAVLARLPPDPGQRVLDLGCGTGELALALQRRRPDLDITGIDISSHNVALARARVEASTGPSQPAFVHADYLAFAGAGFDAILADSVLHLIPIANDVLVGKLSRDLTPGGLLIATLPIRSVGNAALMLQRRVWRRLPRIVDAPVMHLARLMHPEEPPQVLADRIIYLRLLPSRLLDGKLSSELSQHGLRPVSTLPWPNPSVFKLRHGLAVYQKSDALR